MGALTHIEVRLQPLTFVARVVPLGSDPVSAPAILTMSVSINLGVATIYGLSSKTAQVLFTRQGIEAFRETMRAHGVETVQWQRREIGKPPVLRTFKVNPERK